MVNTRGTERTYATEGRSFSLTLKKINLFQVSPASTTTTAAVAAAASSAEASSSSTNWVPVLRPEDLPKGSRREVRVNGRPVLLFWYRNQVRECFF